MSSLGSGPRHCGADAGQVVYKRYELLSLIDNILATTAYFQITRQGIAMQENQSFKQLIRTDDTQSAIRDGARVLQGVCHGLARESGWWTDLETGEDVRQWPKKHFKDWVGTKIGLIMTEGGEAMEGHRTGANDDHLPNRSMLECELADVVIRAMDLAGGLGLDLPGAIAEKLVFNATREDHKIENRLKEGGKAY